MEITLVLSLMPVMVCAVWSIIFLLDYLLHHSESHKYLWLFMSVATLLYVGHYTFFVRALHYIPYTDTMYCMCNLAVYPLYLIYIVYMTKGHVGLRQWLLLLPSLLGGVSCAALYGMMDEPVQQQFIAQYLYKSSLEGLTGLALIQAWIHNVCRLIFVFLLAWVCAKGCLLIRDFCRQVASGYADTEGRTLRPVRVLLLLLTIISFISIIFLLLGRSRFAMGDHILAIPSVIFSTLLFCIGYVGSQPMFAYREYAQEQEEYASMPEEPTAEIHPSRVETLAVEIERLMTEEKMYRQHDLRITDVARQLGTNSKYVSLAFNQVIGRPFADYVNEQRILYARELKQQHPDMVVTEIAHKAGYSSMQSFYRNLKKWGK